MGFVKVSADICLSSYTGHAAVESDAACPVRRRYCTSTPVLPLRSSLAVGLHWIDKMCIPMEIKYSRKFAVY